MSEKTVEQPEVDETPLKTQIIFLAIFEGFVPRGRSCKFQTTKT